MKWVLIWFAAVGYDDGSVDGRTGATTGVAHFASAEACEAARVTIGAPHFISKYRRFTVTAFCFPTGATT